MSEREDGKAESLKGAGGGYLVLAGADWHTAELLGVFPTKMEALAQARQIAAENDELVSFVADWNGDMFQTQRVMGTKKGGF